VRAYGDGWFPQPGRMLDDDSFIERISPYRGEFEMSAFGARRKPETLERYAEAGLSRAVFWVPPGDRSEVERYLDEIPRP
jgi:hypothetical protein